MTPAASSKYEIVTVVMTIMVCRFTRVLGQRSPLAGIAPRYWKRNLAKKIPATKIAEG